MTPRRLATALGLLVAGAVGLTACGSAAQSSREAQLDRADRQNATIQRGARLFAERCAGCHTLRAVSAEGSSFTIKDRERTDGPNFNVRTEEVDQVLYAIRNGGYSGAIMPQNIVTGPDAQAVAEFVAKYAGRDAKAPKTPGGQVQPTARPRPEVRDSVDNPQAEQPVFGP